MSSLGEYSKRYRDIQAHIKAHTSEKPKEAVRIALLADTTITGIIEPLWVECFDLGLMSEIYCAPYNQYIQEITDAQSKLYLFKPDIVFVFVSTKASLGDYVFSPYVHSLPKRKRFMLERVRELERLLHIVADRSDAKIVVHTLSVPTYSPIGIAETKEEFGLIESIRSFNKNLIKTFVDDSQIIVFDYESFSSNIGKRNLHDPKLYHLGDISISSRHLPELADSYVGYIKPLVSRIKKCIVLDFDNTLWGGIVGEEGVGGIKLGPTPDGQPYFEFQKHLLALYERGVVLAGNSRNNPEDVREVFRSHPHMILKEKHFSALEINWNDKATNLKAISKELSIGLDSLVFFDDDPVNRELARKEVPEVLTVELPEDPSLYVDVLERMTDFNSFRITKEDRTKGVMYKTQSKRRQFEAESATPQSFLKGLRMEATIEQASLGSIPRIAQLTQKTNQFNLTTRRYTEEDIQAFVDRGCLVATLHLTDRFGDNGIVGLAIASAYNDKLNIDTFLLSCRVIGRGVEKALLAYIVEYANTVGVHEIVGEYVQTSKNIPASRLYEENSFTKREKKKGVQYWTHPTTKQFAYPDHIRIIKPTAHYGRKTTHYTHKRPRR